MERARESQREKGRERARQTDRHMYRQTERGNEKRKTWRRPGGTAYYIDSVSGAKHGGNPFQVNY